MEKITINAGVGEAVSDRKRLDDVANNVTQIAGQKAVLTKANFSNFFSLITITPNFKKFMFYLIPGVVIAFR